MGLLPGRGRNPEVGGVTRGNSEKLVELGADALPTFKAAADLLRPDTADTSNLDGVGFMNAGWTKVYALMLDGFPIYGLESSRRLRALEAALFMIGCELPSE